MNAERLCHVESAVSCRLFHCGKNKIHPVAPLSAPQQRTSNGNWLKELQLVCQKYGRGSGGVGESPFPQLPSSPSPPSPHLPISPSPHLPISPAPQLPSAPLRGLRVAVTRYLPAAPRPPHSHPVPYPCHVRSGLSDRCAGQPAWRKVRAPQDTVVGNAHHSQGSGQCHRKQTASRSPQGGRAVRVKRCGKSAPRFW